jgi:hypothetical protein
MEELINLIGDSSEQVAGAVKRVMALTNRQR